MTSPSFRSLSVSEVDLDLIDHKTLRANEDAADTRYESTTSLLAIKGKAPERSWHTTTRSLRIAALILHSVLISTFLVLIVIWARGIENRITVALKYQKIVFYLITTTTTTFGNIYSAALLFVTQTLATRRSLRTEQLLTVTHDTAAAWVGIGTAVSLLWNQARVPAPASTMAALPVATYLAAIFGLHITSSSLFSLVVFNSTRTYSLPTQGLPAFNGTPSSDTVENMIMHTSGSLYFLPSILSNDGNPGLHGGTLYDVLDNARTVPGNATVHATGFNMTCGFLAVPKPFTESNGEWSTLGPSNESLIVMSTQPGIISRVTTANSSMIVFYSTIPIIDSDGQQGPLVPLDPPMNTSIASIQVFQCYLSLVDQVASIDSQTQQIHAVAPDFTKTTSRWIQSPVLAASDLDNGYQNISNGNDLIDAWLTWYKYIPKSEFFLDNNAPPVLGDPKISFSDLYFIQKLNLPAANHTDTRNITLHDFENALSTVVASMFWTMGHISPPYRATNFLYNVFTNGTDSDPVNNVTSPPILIPGIGNVIESFAETQLELNPISLFAGLAVSIALMAVSLPLLQSSGVDEDPPINGTGILHAIWMYRNHPELQKTLEHVEHPTDENLRAAGMVRTRLVSEGSNKEKTSV
ncbi:hypothetical protein MSAN_00468800 [Mycena sanguinolenta]|uniref:Transmembrane protein n=1 Tax=Mycena sanguinolenta TaxID=230812 RepID=A0A8H7DLN6_9AGAR|nr:hypothetical protein MSAN_00468800 [Mycena sanguinolenta]